MEDEGDYTGPELMEKLSQDWLKFANQNNATNSFLKESMQKNIGDQAAGEVQFTMFFNKNLDINRFFIEDSDGKKGADDGTGMEMPQVESAGGMGGASSGFADNSDPFEDALEDALCVFKSGDGNSDILEKNEKLIMFSIDLENETIIDRTGGAGEETKLPSTGESYGGEQMSESKHPVLLNQYPVCKYHSLFLLFPDAGLPQVLSDELLVLLLQIFKLSD